MSEVALQANGLVKWFGDGPLRTTVIRDVSFEARFGELLYLVGPSGSGKTTLLSMLSGILRPDSGEVALEGTDIWHLDTDALAQFRLHRIGFVFQDFHLFPRLTTAENVAVPLILRRQPWNQAISQAKLQLEQVGLGERCDLPPVKLSGGEQQRVAIARAVVGKPDFLILDEPTAALDGDTGRRVLEMVRKEMLTGQRCILIVTHDARIFEFADRILHLEDGRLTGEETGQRQS